MSAALTIIFRSVIISQERKSQMDVVYLDIRKAFDSIPLGKLLMKLHEVGIVGKLWNLPEDYLTSREQCIVFDDITSGFVPVTSGVP